MRPIRHIGESNRIARGISPEAMIQDFKFAFRQLVKSPGFTAIAIITLALAIGVNAGMFALVNGALLKPLAPERPHEVVSLFSAREGASRDYRQFSHAEYMTLRESKDVFSDVAAVNFALAGVGRQESMRRSFAFLTSDNFFSLMGAKPALGRFYNAEEAKPNANIPVVVTSYAFWKRNGGRADFVGSTLYINGQPYTVIGIAPEGFSGISALLAPDIWLPLGVYSQLSSAFSDSANLSDLAQPKNYTLNVVARMGHGLTLDALKSRLPALSQRLTAIQSSDASGARELQATEPSRFSVSTTPSEEGPVGVMGVLMMAMAGAVLLIACLNLANMLLARGTARAKEMAIRIALGSSRWRIIRQLLCEGLLLAVAGGVVGLFVSLWSNRLLFSSLTSLFGSMSFSIAIPLNPDAVVLGVTFLFCLLATLFFSLGPALKATKPDLVNDLKQQAGEPAQLGRINRFFAPRHLLVMAQVSLSLMLLFGAGLFLRGALKASGVELGFEARDGLVAEMDFTLANTPEENAKRTMFAMVQRVKELPGVRGAALATMIPYGNTTNARRVMPSSAAIAAKADPNAPDPGVNGLYTSTTPGYFETIGVRILRGRDFTQAEAENKETPKVAIVDERMAEKLFPNADALGQRIRGTNPQPDGSSGEMEIVGIVSSHRHEVLGSNIPSRLFVPLAQAYNGAVYLHVRTSSMNRAAVTALIPTLRQTLRNIDPNMPILRIEPFTDVIEKNIGLWIIRMGAIMFGIFGGIALLLAVVGVYGVKAYAVARRTREIGIRMALGAHPRDVFALIMKQGALQTGFALALGLLLSLGAGRVLAQMLYQVSPADPLALIISSFVLAAAALLACFFPARRATRVSPMTALRTE
ncbi:MAG TPA: ABC transporter permease [Chthoniobacterales bacterium]|nr:ABC transporter permease [Chthoniobacterales bacterium]